MSLYNKCTRIKLFFIALFLVLCQPLKAAVLSQEQGSMMEYVIKERPLLADLVTKAGLAPLLSGGAPVTLLTPPESALQNLREESPERLRAILAAHIVKGEHMEQDLKDGASLTALSGNSLTICRVKGYTLVNGVRIQQADQKVKNGILHELEGVIRI